MSSETIFATDRMRAIVDDLIDGGYISRSAAEYARKNKYTDADIIEARERVRLSRARLEVQSRPLQYREDKPKAMPGEPTPEQKRKGGKYLTSAVVGKGETAPLRRYRLRSVMEMHGDKLHDAHRMAFAAFVGDADLHQRMRVADLNGSGGGSGKPRTGGLGNVPQQIRDRYNRYEWVSKRLTRLEREVCDVLVTHCVSKRDGSPFSAEEYGALVFPTLADKSFHRGAAINGFRHFCDHLVELFHDPLCPRISRAEIEADNGQ